ncbi:hypothetical protein [Thermococcus sp.]|uniref:hypothetical protein n=1 Tax=Thermococcus sp. TaxID=35749 RepID=UPI0025CE92D0|nr:hypothetical protein [Thermococcus sp.]
MKRGQISLDFLFAVTLITITMLNLVYIADSERAHSETFDTIAKLKAFSIDVRDSVVKVYTAGDGFTVRKELPINLDAGDKVTVSLLAPDSVVVNATIGGKGYRVAQRSPVPIYENTSVTLTGADRDFSIVATYNETEGRLDVTLSP